MPIDAIVNQFNLVGFYKYNYPTLLEIELLVDVLKRDFVLL
jgi:hypothetical protein